MKTAFKSIICTLLLSVTLLGITAFAEETKLRIGLFYSSTALSSPQQIEFPVGFSVGSYTKDSGFNVEASHDSQNAVVSINANGALELSDTASGEIYKACAAGESLYVYPYCAAGSIPYTSIKGTKFPELIEFTADENGRIKAINIVGLEQYIKGVLPSEVYTSWENEALKTQAVATRTYSLKSIGGKHSSQGFDLCTTTCCQVYSGLSKTAESTNRAVDETYGQVVMYDGKLATTVYHAISGGITESAYGAWGGSPSSYPYLTVVETPFEDYNSISRGKWTVSISPTEMLDYINTSTSWKGKLSGDIASITYNTDGGGYIHSMTVTDVNGNSIDVKTSSYVRSLLSKFAYSANFTIGRTFTPSDEKTDSITVMTSSGKQTASTGSGYSYLTASGKGKTYGISDVYFLDGKGFGHGVGLSQYGAQFAAKQGYSYLEIISTYFPGTTVESRY